LTREDVLALSGRVDGSRVRVTDRWGGSTVGYIVHATSAYFGLRFYQDCYGSDRSIFYHDVVRIEGTRKNRRGYPLYWAKTAVVQDGAALDLTGTLQNLLAGAQL
jgi:hypothetical protein